MGFKTAVSINEESVNRIIGIIRVLFTMRLYGLRLKNHYHPLVV
jgi:hypothetical protein